MPAPDPLCTSCRLWRSQFPVLLPSPWLHSGLYMCCTLLQAGNAWVIRVVCHVHVPLLCISAALGHGARCGIHTAHCSRQNRAHEEAETHIAAPLCPRWVSWVVSSLGNCHLGSAFREALGCSWFLMRGGRGGGVLGSRGCGCALG